MNRYGFTENGQSRSVSHETMGDWLGDFGNWLGDRVGWHFDLGIQNILPSIVDAVRNINWDAVNNNLSIASRFVGNLMVQINPLYFVTQGLLSWDVTSHSFREFDKLLGGGITDLTNLSTLPARTIKGDAIHQDELITDAIFICAVLSTVFTAGQGNILLRLAVKFTSRGTLGKSELGRAVLKMGGGVGGALITGGDVSDVAYKTGVGIGLEAGQTETLKSTDLGKTKVGQIATGAGFAAAGGELVGTGAGGALTEFGKGTAISEAGKTVPGGDTLAKHIIDKGVSFPGLPSSGGSSTDSEDSSSSGWGGIGNLFSSISLADIPGRISDALSHISMPGAPSLEGLQMPSFSMPQINIGNIPDITLPNGLTRKVKSRRRKRYADGVEVWEDTLDDGSIYEEEYQPLMSPWVIAGLVFLTVRSVVDRKKD